MKNYKIIFFLVVIFFIPPIVSYSQENEEKNNPDGKTDIATLVADTNIIVDYSNCISDIDFKRISDQTSASLVEDANDVAVASILLNKKCLSAEQGYKLTKYMLVDDADDFAIFVCPFISDIDNFYTVTKLCLVDDVPKVALTIEKEIMKRRK